MSQFVDRLQARYQQDYLSKLKSPEDAVKLIKSGHRVIVHSGAGEPEILIRALIDRANELRDVEIAHLLTLGRADYVDPKYADIFFHRAFFVGSNVRKAVSEGRAAFTPIFLSEIPGLFSSGRLPVDVALLQLSPPDSHGWMSYGVDVDINKGAAEAAEIVIAVVNRRMPRTLGDSFIHLSQLHALVEADSPILELPRSEDPSGISNTIGRWVATLIPDGACLQMGIGAIPDAVLNNLSEKSDLGIHTEMFSDGILPLVHNGNINGKRKTLHKGKIVSSFCLGTRELYDFVDDNPMVEMHPSDYVNDPAVIYKNDQMMAINSALMVDLSGQVCADSMGYSIYSGIGGQVDFIRGASRSKGGRPIIALPATAKDGAVSRIVPGLPEGSGVVTSRGDVHYVITEFGIADLWGKTVGERAKALVEIAHPKFRDELQAAMSAHRWR